MRCKNIRCRMKATMVSVPNKNENVFQVINWNSFSKLQLRIILMIGVRIKT